MSTSPAKNSILKKIRLALSESTPIPFPKSEGTDPVHQHLQQDIVVEFAEQFTQLQGKFVFCADEEELLHQFATLCQQHGWTKIYCTDKRLAPLADEKFLTGDIVGCDISLTACECLVARTGSLLLSARNSGRIPSVYAPVHVCVAYTSQLVYDIKDGLNLLKNKYKNGLPSLVTLATGPSRTADIEKTLVVGVHGPKEVYLFLVEG
ncbi:MAG TPA: LUD domain-containing protein [Chitinophagaceae bacterium]